MKLRHERLAEMIRTTASEYMVRFFQEHEHTNGIVSIIEVLISSDEGYADIYVCSSEKSEEKGLPKILAPLANKIAHTIGKDMGIRRAPIIRFRGAKKEKTSQDVLSIIHSLDQQYGLSK